MRRTAALLLLMLDSPSAEAGEGVVQSEGLSAEMLLWFLPTVFFCILVLARIDAWAQGTRRLIERRRQGRQRPGSSPLLPVRAESYASIAHRTVGSCHCGPSRRVVYEGATFSGHRRLWLVIEMCPECHDRQQTYYDVTEARDPIPLSTSPATPASR